MNKEVNKMDLGVSVDGSRQLILSEVRVAILSKLFGLFGRRSGGAHLMSCFGLGLKLNP